LNTSKKNNPNIGIINESSLHRTLKFKYTGSRGQIEAEAGNYVTDGINNAGEYIEVQTGSFAPLRKKVKYLAAGGKVHIIHPVALTKKIELFDEDGSFIHCRKSPLKGSFWNIFDALLHAPDVPLIKGVTIEVALIDIIEKRIKDGKGARRRKGISIIDRELAAWHERILLKKPSDFLRFIPFKKGEEFTSLLLSERAGINTDMARKALYVLTKMKIIKRKGKNKNSWIYVR
jgi:hypothetical protein